MTIKLLLADDEPNQLELLVATFSNPDFSVIRARDGRQAIDMAEENLPDLIILDWMMPNISGVDACKIIRSRKETKLTPIIILSARGEDTDKSFGLDSGADDYVSKPFSPKELISRAKALLRRSRPSLVNETLEHNDIKISKSLMEVTRAGKHINLGPKEFRIISLLMERPGQVYSRIQLLDIIWGNTVYVEDRTVDVHMSRLRKAFKKSSPELGDVIRTVRNGGYAMRVR